MSYYSLLEAVIFWITKSSKTFPYIYISYSSAKLYPQKILPSNGIIMYVSIWQNRSPVHLCVRLLILRSSNDTISRYYKPTATLLSSISPNLFSVIRTLHITNFLSFHVNVGIIDSLHLYFQFFCDHTPKPYQNFSKSS